MDVANEIFNRSQLILGKKVMERLAAARVIVFGVGGVGSWCVESLIRTGLTHITIVDSDRVAASNINRQLMATTASVGEVKVAALKRRLLDINPDAEINAIRDIYCADTAAGFDLSQYDFVIDAIDSIENKVLLINNACDAPGKPVLFSSMGAALKSDPTRISTAEFWKVEGCPLAAALRRRFKKSGHRPSRKFKCVFSPELLPNRGDTTPPERNENGDIESLDWNARKAQINGSLPHVTAVFGFTLASLVVNKIYDETYKNQ